MILYSFAASISCCCQVSSQVLVIVEPDPLDSRKKYQRWAVSVWIWLILGAGGAAVGAGTAYFSAALLADAGRAAVAEQTGARPPVPETGSGSSRPAELVREVGFVERNGRDDASAGTPRATPWQVSQLFELANHQIAEGRIDGPIGDNALETYRLLAALSSDEPSTTELGTRLSVALWRLAMTAREGGLWDQSLRYFEDLHMLPPVPSEEISSRPEPASVPAEDSPGSPSPQPAPESGTAPMPEDVAPKLIWSFARDCPARLHCCYDRSRHLGVSGRLFSRRGESDPAADCRYAGYDGARQR